MTASILKKRITKAIEQIEDEHFLQALYTIISSNTPSKPYTFTKEDEYIVEERRAKYLSGKAKTYTTSEVRKRAIKNLQKK